MDVGLAIQQTVAQGDSLLLQLGVGGIFAFIIIKEVLSFVLKNKKNGNDTGRTTTPDMFVLLRSIESLVKDLHNWHDVRDEDQVPVWYIRRSLERQIERLCDAVDQMGKATDAQTDAVEEVLTAVLDEMKELHRRLDQQGGTSRG